jgi:hypothetical protein
MIEPRSAISTIYHPDQLIGSVFDDLAEYLRFDFDRDRVFDLPKDFPNVAVFADLSRYSRFSYPRSKRLGNIALNLQPAVDVAKMTIHYWRSQVWPARVAFDLLAVLGEVCLGNAMNLASGFVNRFVEHRLRQLITDSQISKPDQPSRWFSSRIQMFGSLEERALIEQLAAFQIFHEVGHFVGFGKAAGRGDSFSVEEEKDELECDDFACEELNIAYGESLGIEFLESARVSVFLSILIWTLAEQLPKLEDVEFRARTFDTLMKRSRAATMHVYRFAHRGEPPSERLDMDALRYFPTFNALLRILDTFFAEAVLNNAETFDCQGSLVDTVLATPRAAAAIPAGAMEKFVEPWESIWAKEDDLAEEKAELLRSSYKTIGRQQRSRPMLSGVEFQQVNKRKPRE